MKFKKSGKDKVLKQKSVYKYEWIQWKQLSTFARPFVVLHVHPLKLLKKNKNLKHAGAC